MVKLPPAGIKLKSSFNKLSVLKDLHHIRILSFASDGKALLYSGIRVDSLTDIEIFNNWRDAEKYATKHGMRPVQHTEGGAYLDVPNRFIGYKTKYNTDEIAAILWRLASQKYIQQIIGDVKTLVCCAGHNSTFRAVELPELLKNDKVKTINDKPRSYYTTHYDRVLARLSQHYAQDKAVEFALDSTYRLITKQEIAADFRRAAADHDTSLATATQLRQTEMAKHVQEERIIKATTDYKNPIKVAEELLAEALKSNPRIFQQLVRHTTQLPKMRR